VTAVTSRIKPLSLQLANQIAAGEVVERPASVVKEILENALDAGCSQINIDIERGGSSLIRISDNGEGINKADLALAVTRHATSKLHSLTELERVNSLGFRGEALASISAVSKLSIQSKQEEQEQAWMINTGTDSDFANYSAEAEPVAHPQGTTVDVRDLFYNTPARRKFMRTVKTEFKHIDDIVKRIALSQFNIAFKLTHNKKLLRNLPKAVTEKAINQRISKLFSPEFLSHAKKVDFTTSHFSNMGKLRLSGWISEPQWHRNQPDWQYFYVNGRYIKDKLVSHALRQAYQELLPAETYSAYLLYLEIAPEQVDVNVHPTKHEVRFRQARLIHDFIYSALNQAISSEPSALLQEPSALQHEPSALPQEPSENITSVNQDSLQVSHEHNHRNSAQPSYADYQAYRQPIVSQHNVAEHLDGLHKLYQVEKNQDPNEKTIYKAEDSRVFFGKILGCSIADYLLTQKESAEKQTQLFVINIKSAQQFLLTQLFHPGQPSPLLIPQSLALATEDIERILEQQSELSKLGLEVSQLSADTLLIRSLPSLYGIPGCQVDAEGLIKRVLKRDKTSALKEVLINSLMTSTLNYSEQEQLLTELSEQINHLDLPQDFINKQSIWVTLDQSGLDKLFA